MAIARGVRPGVRAGAGWTPHLRVESVIPYSPVQLRALRRGLPQPERGPDCTWRGYPAGPAHPARPRSSPWVSPPRPLGRWGSPRVVGSRRPHQSFPALKCGFWLLRKSPPCPCGAPCPSSSFVPPLADGATFPWARQDGRKGGGTANFRLAPRASLLHPSGRSKSWRRCPAPRQGGSLRLSGACARGVELRWIVRGSQACQERQAEGGAETHPAGWRGCGNRGGEAGTPAASFPQHLSPDVVPLRWDGCAALRVCLAASTEQLIV